MSAQQLGAIQVLRNAVGGGGVGGCQISLKKSVTKMYDSTLLALRGGVGGCQISRKKVLHNT